MNTFTLRKRGASCCSELMDKLYLHPAQVFDKLLDTTESIFWDFDLSAATHFHHIIIYRSESINVDAIIKS
jgi:hypothetical protein